MAQTVGEWAARAATLPAALVEATPEAVRASGVVLDTAVKAGIAAVTGGDSVLSRVRSGKGARISTRTEVRGAGSRAEAVVVPSGPIMLVENDTRPHTQPFKYKNRRRVKAKRTGVVAFGGKVYASVDHPGTKGRKPVAKAFAASADDAGRAGVLVFATTVRSHLRGAS